MSQKWFAKIANINEILISQYAHRVKKSGPKRIETALQNLQMIFILFRFNGGSPSSGFMGMANKGSVSIYAIFVINVI